MQCFLCAATEQPCTHSDTEKKRCQLMLCFWEERERESRGCEFILERESACKAKHRYINATEKWEKMHARDCLSQ